MCAVRSIRKRGRPSKFGRPSRLVAVTLPEEVIRGLRKIHPDLAWAVVSLFEKGTPRAAAKPQSDVELVSIGRGQSLIVVNRTSLKRLPGVAIVPLTHERLFLALEPGCGMGDLERTVLDRLKSTAVDSPEHSALVRLRRELQAWRRNRALHFRTRAIIVVERARSARARR